jgi:hypothetical protein
MALLMYWFKDDPNLQPYPALLNYNFPEFIVEGTRRRPPGAQAPAKK